MLIVEDGNRPWRMVRRSLTGNNTVSGAPWVSFNAGISSIGSDKGTGVRATSYTSSMNCFINCTNQNEIYSFHNGYANFLWADASVRALRDDLTAAMLIAVMTKKRNDRGPVPEY